MSVAQARSKAMEALQRDTFNYFVHEANPVNGLVIDKTQPGTPARILMCVKPGAGQTGRSFQAARDTGSTLIR